MILQYHMLRGNEFPPLRANPSDAGLDLRWVPREGVETAFRIESRRECPDTNWLRLCNPAWIHDGD